MIEFKVDDKDIMIDVKIKNLKNCRTSKIIEALKEITDCIMSENTEKSHAEEYFKAGYQALVTDKKGLHHPESEYESTKRHESKDYGIKEVAGEKKYQLFYVCHDCGNKGKRFIPKGSIYTNCHECGKRMNVRPSTTKGVGHKDDYSNYYIAGDFQPEEKHRELVG